MHLKENKEQFYELSEEENAALQSLRIMSDHLRDQRIVENREKKTVDLAASKEFSTAFNKGSRSAAAPRGIGLTLEGSSSAVPKPNFASKYAFESSRRDLHNALLCTALQSHFLLQIIIC